MLKCHSHVNTNKIAVMIIQKGYSADANSGCVLYVNISHHSPVWLRGCVPHANGSNYMSVLLPQQLCCCARGPCALWGSLSSWMSVPLLYLCGSGPVCFVLLIKLTHWLRTRSASLSTYNIPSYLSFTCKKAPNIIIMNMWTWQLWLWKTLVVHSEFKWQGV